MLTLPAELLSLIIEYAPLFSKPVWEHARILLVGAILAPGKRTVTACLRVMGLSQEKRFVNYHRVLNRARWSALEASRILLRLLIATFAPTGELVFGIDDTIERRRGAHLSLRQRLRGNKHKGRKWEERTPAMAAGLTDHIWAIEELLEYHD